MSITRLRLITLLVFGMLGHMITFYIDTDMPNIHKSSQNISLAVSPHADEITYEYYLDLHQQYSIQTEVDTMIRTILVCTELTKINIINSQPQYCDKRQKKFLI